MSYFENIIWFLVPVMINRMLIYLFRKKLEMPNKKFVLLWLLFIGVYGFFFSPQCTCIGNIERIEGALIGSSIFSVIVFLFGVILMMLFSYFKRKLKS
jgi:hypothetical protein